MTSQRSSSLSQKSEECFNIDKHNFQESLPRLKEFLREADRHVQLRAVKTLLGPCLAFCSPIQLAKTLLDDVAPVARGLFFETINEVEDLLSSSTVNVCDDVGERLECCENLLESWLQCLVLLGKFEKLSASQVRGVLENIVEVIKRSFEHCKASEEIYGDSFEKSKEKLTILFRKTNEVQKIFSIVLERAVVFSNDVEAEVSTLTKVVRLSGEICSLVDGLDMKTFAESWKGFAKIAIAYCDDLKILPPCVTPHLVSLADSVSSALSSTVIDPDQRSAERSIKLQRLFLKILHKLCLSYSGHLGIDAASAVIRLLVQLHRYSPSCLKTLNVHHGIIDCIEANFISGIDQLLDSVISDAEFRQAYFQYQAAQKSGDIGFHLLTVRLLKKLIATPTEIQITWCRFPHNILEVTFLNINSLEEELFVGQLRLGVLPLYDATFTSICGLVVSARDLDFQSLEITLLKNLLGGNFWSSILASDVWCFVDRYSACSDLSHDHLLYLMSVYEILTNRDTCTETVIVGNLIARLYTLSSSETKNRLIEEFERSKARFWAPLKRCLSQSDRRFLSAMASSNMDKSIARVWETLYKQPSAEVWTTLMNQLTVIGNFGKPDNETFLKTVTAIWNYLDKSMGEFDGIHLHLVAQLTAVLLDATQALQNEDENIYPILSTLTSLVPRAVPRIRASVSHYLKDSTDNFLRSGPEMITALAKLYCSLLEDGNPLSQEEALESFAHVTTASYNEELVIGIVNALAEVPEIGGIVSRYLSHTATGSLRGFPTGEDYLRQLLERCQITGHHVCLDRGESRRDEKRRKLAVIEARPARPGTPEELRDRLERLSRDVDHVLSRKKDMGESSLHKLQIIANKIIRDNNET